VARIALNLLRQQPAQGALKGNRYQAALNEDFLLNVLKSSFDLIRLPFGLGVVNQTTF